jgi:hypothetical protein
MMTKLCVCVCVCAGHWSCVAHGADPACGGQALLCQGGQGGGDEMQDWAGTVGSRQGRGMLVSTVTVHA